MLGDGHGPATVRKVVGVLKLTLDLALEYGMIRKNPCVGVKLPQMSKQEMHYLTAEQVEVHGVRFHDLRHTCAALLIAEGAHPKAIQQRMGHSSITVTLDRYGHLLPSLDDSLSDALDRTWRTAQVSRPSLPESRPSLSGPQDGEHNMLGPDVVDSWSADDGEHEAEAESGL